MFFQPLSTDSHIFTLRDFLVKIFLPKVQHESEESTSEDSLGIATTGRLPVDWECASYVSSWSARHEKSMPGEAFVRDRRAAVPVLRASFE